MATTAQTKTLRDPFVGPYATQINAAAVQNGLDPWELAAVFKHESGFDPKADNGADRGIAQINRAAHPAITDAQAFNPAFAIPWAARYLRGLLNASGSWTGALRAYNTGSPRASTAGNGYVADVEAAYRSLRSKVGGYVFPVAGAYTFGRLDQGVDLKGTPGQHAVAIGNGVVDAVKSDPGGFGQAIYLTLTGGAMDGQQIYYGHAQADVKPGQRVTAGDPVATLLQTPLGNATEPGWLEVGFASGGAPVSKSASDTASAKRFNDWITSLSAPSSTGTGGTASDVGFTIPLPLTPGGPPLQIPIPSIGGVGSVGDAFSLFKKLFTDPAGTLGAAVLFLGLMLLGFALVYLGITRLLGAKPVPTVLPVPV